MKKIFLLIFLCISLSESYAQTTDSPTTTPVDTSTNVAVDSLDASPIISAPDTPMSATGASTTTVTNQTVLAMVNAILDSTKNSTDRIGTIELKNNVIPVYTVAKMHDYLKNFKQCSYCVLDDENKDKKENFLIKSQHAITTTQKDTVKRVELNIKNGNIDFVRVTLSSGKMFENGTNPISIRQMNEYRPNNVLYDVDGGDCIIANDVLRYKSAIDRRYYIPDDDTMTLVPNLKNSAILTKNVDLNSNIDFRLYSDVLGLLNKQSNGLVQADVKTKIFINTNTSKGITFFNYLEPNFTYSKFDSKYNAIQVKDSLQPLFLSDTERVALYQTSYLDLGVKLSFSKILIRNSYIEENAGVDYYFSNVQLGSNPDIKIYNSWAYYGEIAGELLKNDNFGLDFSLKFLVQNSVSSNLQIYTYKDAYFIPEVTMFYYPNDNFNNKIFLKFRVTDQIGSNYQSVDNIYDTHRAFFSLQFGYSAKLNLSKGN